MRLLITTQAVDENDPTLGFFVRWLEEFSRQCESVLVICLREGKHSLPHNVRVRSLGKEKGPQGKLAYASRFLRLIREHRAEYDAVLVHMNPEYLVLGGLLWRRWGKRIGLWYVHKSVNAYLRLGTFFADYIFTASKESFRMRSKNLRIVGHGIDTTLFSDRRIIPHEDLRVVTIGRITPAKRIIEMLAGIAEYRSRGHAARFSIVGAPATEADHSYKAAVLRGIEAYHLHDVARVAGPVPYAQIPAVLADADVVLNLSKTGSVDKAVLDAFAAGVPVVTSNEAFASVPVALYIPEADAESIADALEKAGESDPAKLRAYVEQYHSLPRLVREIVRDLSS